MFIDVHAHAFADKIADKAVAQLIDYYKMPTEYGGRLSDLMREAKAAGLDALVLLVAATKPEQVKPANDWVLGVAGTDKAAMERNLGLRDLPEIVPFGTFHPRDPNWLSEIQRLHRAGIKGIKIHPEFQGIDLGDPALNDFWAEVEEDFIVLVHVGDPAVGAANLSTPAKIAAILDKFPRIRLIAAHLGGLYLWEEAYATLAGRDVYLDTSSAVPYMDPRLFRSIVAKHGTERILFGSDYPLRSPSEEWELLERIPWLSGTDRDRIRGDNCAHLLGLYGNGRT